MHGAVKTNERRALLNTSGAFFLIVTIGFFADGFLRADGHLAKVVIRTVVDVEVDIAFDTW